MFGFDFWEILIILVVALIVVGPKRMPEIARTLGKTMRQLRRASDDLRRNLDEAMAEPPPPRPTPPSPAPTAALPATKEDPYRQPETPPEVKGPEPKDG